LHLCLFQGKQQIPHRWTVACSVLHASGIDLGFIIWNSLAKCLKHQIVHVYDY
jgi:hypothetical protein